MNLSNIILQFAKACKDAQTILNTEGTGGKEGNVPVLIKEAEFKYTLECSLDFTNKTDVSVSIFRAKVSNQTTINTNKKEGLDLRILFVSEMVLTNETVESAK